MLEIAKNRAYLNDFYVVDCYARETLGMTIDVHIKDDDKTYFPSHPELPLSGKDCEVVNERKDVRLLC